MSERVWSSEERRVALEQVSRMIGERQAKAREERYGVSIEACEDFQTMQVAVELRCRLTEMEAIANRALDRANKYMDLCGGGAAPEGVKVIALERLRQIVEEGWTPEHDDDEHDRGDLCAAAECYCLASVLQLRGEDPKGIERGTPFIIWPWAKEWWKPSDDPIRNLVKAGALIAAEIDRLYRAGGAS